MFTCSTASKHSTLKQHIKSIINLEADKETEITTPEVQIQKISKKFQNDGIQVNTPISLRNKTKKNFATREDKQDLSSLRIIEYHKLD